MFHPLVFRPLNRERKKALGSSAPYGQHLGGATDPWDFAGSACRHTLPPQTITQIMLSRQPGSRLFAIAIALHTPRIAFRAWSASPLPTHTEAPRKSHLCCKAPLKLPAQEILVVGRQRLVRSQRQAFTHACLRRLHLVRWMRLRLPCMESGAGTTVWWSPPHRQTIQG